MTDTQPRGKDQGGAVGDGTPGSYAPKSQSPHELGQIRSNVEREVSVAELEPGDVIIGPSGSRLTVGDVAPSSAMPGLHCVENEFGTLYLDPEEVVTVAGDTDRSWVLTPGAELPHEALSHVVNDARGRGELAGAIYSKDTVENTILEIAENGADNGDFTEDELFFLDSQSNDPKFIADVFAVVKATDSWQDELGNTDRQNGDRIVEMETIMAIREVLGRPSA